VAAYKGRSAELAGSWEVAVLAGALEIHTVEARHAAGIRYLRQTLLSADIGLEVKVVNYNENRDGFPIIPFSSRGL